MRNRRARPTTRSAANAKRRRARETSEPKRLLAADAKAVAESSTDEAAEVLMGVLETIAYEALCAALETVPPEASPDEAAAVLRAVLETIPPEATTIASLILGAVAVLRPDDPARIS